MGILDIFGGGSPAEKARKLKPKLTQKFGDPTPRQKAIAQLGQLQHPDAVAVLMLRFTFTVEPQTTDADEKDQVFALVKDMGSDAVEPVKAFLRKNDHASSWAVRLLSSLQPEPEVVGFVTAYLTELSQTYVRDPEKKLVLLHFLEGKDDPRIAPAALPFVDDMVDDVKLAALKALGPLEHEPAREPILKLLVAEETAKRVRTAAVAALHESGFGVQGYREKVEAQITDPYFVDKSGLVKKRG